jgi:hypothetical protein
MHTETQQEVVVKTFFSTTRTQDIPAAVAGRLHGEHNITATRWPVEISATLQENVGGLTIHAADVFYAAGAASTKLPWRLVLPLYPCGSLDSAQAALSFLDFSTVEVDWLYRPRYKRVFEALAGMHTTPEISISPREEYHRLLPR